MAAFHRGALQIPITAVSAACSASRQQDHAAAAKLSNSFGDCAQRAFAAKKPCCNDHSLT
jgi:hypothetical protein